MRFRDVVQTTTKLGVLTETHNYQLANRIMNTFGQKQKGQEEPGMIMQVIRRLLKKRPRHCGNCPHNIID